MREGLTGKYRRRFRRAKSVLPAFGHPQKRIENDEYGFIPDLHFADNDFELYLSRYLSDFIEPYKQWIAT